MTNQDLALEIKKLIRPLNYSTWKFKIKNIILCGTFGTLLIASSHKKPLIRIMFSRLKDFKS